MNGMNASTGKTLSGIDHLKQSVVDILTTPKGSRLMRRSYGSDLFSLIDNPTNTETIADIIAESADALKKWETRISVTKVEVTSAQPGKVTLNIIGKYRPTGESIKLEGIKIS